MDFSKLDEDVLLLETKLTEQIEIINNLLHSHHKTSEKNGETVPAHKSKVRARWSKAILAAKIATHTAAKKIRKRPQSILPDEHKNSEEKMVRRWALGALDRESLIGEGDDIFRAFQLNSHGGLSLNEAQQDLAFKSLGVIYPCKVDGLRHPTLDYSGFREIVEKSFRSQRITSALQGVCSDLAELMEPMFPMKITDATEEDILHIMSSQRFFAPASSRIHECLRAAAVDVSKEARRDENPTEEGVAEVDLLSLMSKYRDAGGFVGSSGDVSAFDHGLEARIGLPDPHILRAVILEHTAYADSELPFETSNYSIVTTPKQELALLLGNPADFADTARGVKEKAPVFLLELARAGDKRGPPESELLELDSDFMSLQAEGRLFVGAGAKAVPGSSDDSYSETHVQLCVPTDPTLDPAEGRRQLEAFARLVTNMEEVQKAATGAGRRVRAACSSAPPAPSGGGGGGEMRITVVLPTDSLSDAQLDTIREAVSRALATDQGKVKAKKLGVRTYIYTDRDEEVCGWDPSIVYVRKQARRLRALRDIMGIEEVVNAKMRVEEAMVAYLYTGPLFQKWNEVLRNQGGRGEASPYTTTIHTLVSAVLKLSTLTKIPPGRKVMRGLGGMVLEDRWLTKDDRGVRGGVELGFLSTTTKREVALEYSGVDKDRGTVFEIDIGAVDCGAKLDSISQYPGEGEILFGPLSYLEVVGEPCLEFREGKQIVVVKLKINKNTKSLTIEEMIGKRKRFLLEIMNDFVKEMRFDFKILELGLPQEHVDGCVAKMLDLVKRLETEESVWFNNSHNFQEIVSTALNQKDVLMRETMLQWGDDARYDQDKGIAALLNMAKRGRSDLISMLLCAKLVSVTMRDSQIRAESVYHDKTALHFAAEFGNVDAVKLLCTEMKGVNAALNPRDTYGKTPLHYAAKFHHENVVNCLVDEFQVQADDEETDKIIAEKQDSHEHCNIITSDAISGSESNIAEEESDTSESADASFIKYFGDTLLVGNQRKSTHEVLTGKRAVGIYFSAHWCSPCRAFTPQLRTMFQNLRDSGENGFEIIFVSLDDSERSFDNYFAEMPWAAIPYDQVDKYKDLLVDRFEAEGIPHLVMLDQDCSLISTSGRELIDLYGARGFPFSQERLESLKEESLLRSKAALRSLQLSLNTLLRCSLEGVDNVCLVLGVPDQDRAVSKLSACLPDIELAYPGKFKAAYIPWDDPHNEDHKIAACKIPLVRSSDAETHAMIEAAVGGRISTPQLLMFDRTDETLTIAVADAWGPIMKFGSRGFPWTEVAILNVAEALRKRMPRLESLKTAERSTLLQGAEGEVVEVDTIAQQTDIVGLYFSASWCGPCRHFTPKLAQAYSRLRELGERFEVVLISSDNNEASFSLYFSSMPWLALPFEEKDLATELGELFEVEGIPTLVLINVSDGKLISMDGRSVFSDGDAWPFKKAAFADM